MITSIVKLRHSTLSACASEAKPPSNRAQQVGCVSAWSTQSFVAFIEHESYLGSLNGGLAMNLYLFNLRAGSRLFGKSPCPVRPSPKEHRG